MLNKYTQWIPPVACQLDVFKVIKYFNRAYYHKKDISFAYFEQPLKKRLLRKTTTLLFILANTWACISEEFQVSNIKDIQLSECLLIFL